MGATVAHFQTVAGLSRQSSAGATASCATVVVSPLGETNCRTVAKGISENRRGGQKTDRRATGARRVADMRVSTTIAGPWYVHYVSRVAHDPLQPISIAAKFMLTTNELTHCTVPF
jgi:hypothetical protein